ncbi:MAG: hypothetical protein ACRD13_06635 [Terriglobales bacterium]
MHLMIGYSMGLVWFSLVMVSANMVAFDDSEYRRFGALLTRIAAPLWPGRAGAPPVGA